MSARLSGVIIWLIILAGILVWPFAFHSSTLGDDLIRNTIRLALLYYAITAILLLRATATDWQQFNDRIRLTRVLWTLALLAYLIHVCMAFHYAHNWSHAHAIEHTQEVSGFGEGIFVSHFFTLVWSADVLAWWLVPGWYQTRSVWIDRALHSFMLFIIFNGTVVYETGMIRWAGLAMFALLAGAASSRFIDFNTSRER